MAKDISYLSVVLGAGIASEKIDGLISDDEHFKIGKSGDDYDTTKARYADEYADWEVVYENDNPLLIDDVEKALIEKYKNSHPDTCDNEQEGGGQGEKASYIYLAYN